MGISDVTVVAACLPARRRELDAPPGYVLVDGLDGLRWQRDENAEPWLTLRKIRELCVYKPASGLGADPRFAMNAREVVAIVDAVLGGG